MFKLNIQGKDSLFAVIFQRTFLNESLNIIGVLREKLSFIEIALYNVTSVLRAPNSFCAGDQAAIVLFVVDAAM